MTDLVQLIQEADYATLEMEQTRAAVESAKMALELAKEDFEKAKAAFDQVIAKADEMNIPRAKLRKLAEERSAALMASGILSVPANQAARAPKTPKTPKKKTPKAELAAVPNEDAYEDGNDVIHLDA